ncbi:MAG TPA: glycosyltransferase family 4 protein [Acidiphilium rubrum]|uniref:glycosyltransferase family 4 protein n=2 Tax=Acidocellaceae TaxID=3385905 RepID=UPI0025827144|nr:glycosyltransferase family 4 protein [Acidiphilium sp.]HQT85610.1 glycosyltransferase family 4 protein [Acidiphilium rubrum]
MTRPRLPLPVMRLAKGGPFASVLGPRLVQTGRFLTAAEPRAAGAALARAVLPGRLWRGGRQARGNDVVLGAFISDDEAAWIGARIAAAPPDFILIDTMFRTRLLDRPELQGMRAVVVTHDLFHRRHAALKMAGYRVEPATLTRQDEAVLLDRAGAIVAIQPEEAAFLRDMCPDRPVITVPMPAATQPRPQGVRRDPDRLVFVGSDTLPNLDGLRWFFDAIWPGLRAARPQIALDLAGDCGIAIGRMPPGVRRLGRLADLAPALHGAALAIAPLRTGSGLKVKLLDYARHGLWTVATNEARTGLACDSRPPIFVADHPATFGATILAALAQQPIEADALAFISRHYAAAQIFAPLTDLLEA